MIWTSGHMMNFIISSFYKIYWLLNDVSLISWFNFSCGSVFYIDFLHFAVAKISHLILKKLFQIYNPINFYPNKLCFITWSDVSKKKDEVMNVS